MAQHTYLVENTTGDAIQAQIDKAQQDGGGTVYLPPGTYTLGTSLTVPSGVRLVGAGEATRLKLDAGLGAALFDTSFIKLGAAGATEVRNVEIRRLHIEGPGTHGNLHEHVSSRPDRGCGIIAFALTVAQVVVAECIIENVSGCGIYFGTNAEHPISDVRVEHCRLYDNRIPEERTVTGPDGQPKAERLDAGIYKDILFYGVHFENIRVEGNICTFTPRATNKHGNDSGIAFISNGRSGRVRNAHIVNNVCSGHRRHGIVTSYGRMINDGGYVAANTCDSNGWIGVYANNAPPEAGNGAETAQTGRLVITGNRCAFNGTLHNFEGRPAGFRGGIVLAGVNYSITSDNVCLNNGKVGPALEALNMTAPPESADAPGIRVRGFNNIITGNLLAENAGDGVMMWPGDVGEISITNNRIFRNGGHGIVAAGVPNKLAREVVVVGNLCTGNAKNGINASQVDGLLLAMNFNERNTGGDVSIHPSTKNIRQPELTRGEATPGGSGGSSSRRGGGVLSMLMGLFHSFV